MPPRGLLFDYGGTLVEEVGVDLRAGNEWLLARASYRPAHVTLQQVLERASRIAREVAGRRDDVSADYAVRKPAARSITGSDLTVASWDEFMREVLKARHGVTGGVESQ